MKWTYNTGFAIHGFALLYEITGDGRHVDIPVRMARSAMGPGSFFTDKGVKDPRKRFYKDGSFFLHHLVDGYVALSKHAMREELEAEVRRIGAWGRKWCFDEADGLAYKGCEPWKISEEVARRYNEETGAEHQFQAAKGERDGEGRLNKTLIGCAGWARIWGMEERLR